MLSDHLTDGIIRPLDQDPSVQSETLICKSDLNTVRRTCRSDGTQILEGQMSLDTDLMFPMEDIPVTTLEADQPTPLTVIGEEDETLESAMDGVSIFIYY